MEAASATNEGDARQATSKPTDISKEEDEEKGERTPLLTSARDCSDIETGQAGTILDRLTGHNKKPKDDIDDDGVQTTYEVNNLATFRVFFQHSGTVLQNPVLWKETISTFCIYVALVWVFGYWRWEGFTAFVGKESTIRAFLSMFSNLIGLLLSFYTALNIGRWWSMRLAVQDLWNGATKLSVLLAHGVTSDKELLHSVQRYARGSLFLIFAASQKVKDPASAMVRRGLLTEDEAVQLNNLSDKGIFPQASVPWAWLANAVSALHKQGLTMGPPHLCSLLAAVEQGRAGINTIQTYIETPVPMSYLHILGLMVKTHNLFIAGLYGLICVMHLGGDRGTNEVAIGRTVFRAFFMPFLYNALLIINVDLSNPFDGDVGDLSFRTFDRNIEAEALTMIAASEYRPKWMQGRKYAAWEM